MEAVPEKDPEKPPGLPSRMPLWVVLFLAGPAVFAPSRAVWIAAIAAVAVFSALSLVAPRKYLERAFQVIVLTAIFGSCATLACSTGIYGSAIFGSRKDGGYYLDKSGRYNPGPHYVGTGPELYYGIYLLETTTIVSLALLFAAGFTLHPEDEN